MHFERPAVRLGDRARDEEAEAGSRLRLLAAHAAELLEDERVVLARDAGPAVAHLDAQAPVLRESLHLDLALLPAST